MCRANPTLECIDAVSREIQKLEEKLARRDRVRSLLSDVHLTESLVLTIRDWLDHNRAYCKGNTDIAKGLAKELLK